MADGSDVTIRVRLPDSLKKFPLFYNLIFPPLKMKCVKNVRKEMNFSLHFDKILVGSKDRNPPGQVVDSVSVEWSAFRWEKCVVRKCTNWLVPLSCMEGFFDNMRMAGSSCWEVCMFAACMLDL